MVRDLLSVVVVALIVALIGVLLAALFGGMLLDAMGVHLNPVLTVIALLMPAAVLAFIAARSEMRMRNRGRHEEFPTCSRCGYNLTGNRSGLCPECGAKLKSVN